MFRNVFNLDPSPGENIDYDENLTAPGQEVTIRELLVRFASGENIFAGRPIYYDEDEPVFDPTLDPDFDLADFTSLSDEAKKKMVKKEKKDEKPDPPSDIVETPPTVEPPSME